MTKSLDHIEAETLVRLHGLNAASIAMMRLHEAQYGRQQDKLKNVAQLVLLILELSVTNTRHVITLPIH